MSRANVQETVEDAGASAQAESVEDEERADTNIPPDEMSEPLLPPSRQLH